MYLPKSEAELRAAKLMYYLYVILGIMQLNFYSACSISTLMQRKLPSMTTLITNKRNDSLSNRRRRHPLQHTTYHGLAQHHIVSMTDTD